MKKKLFKSADVDVAAHRLQYAALPWRQHDGLEVMLVSSRETRRWIIPKGWPMKSRKPFAAAAQEALEEAGVIGIISRRPIGSYEYNKRLRNGAVLPCKVDVFPLKVERQRKTWREQRERTTKWFSLEDAADAVLEPDLRDLILRLEGIVAPPAPSTDGKKGPPTQVPTPLQA